MRRAIYAAVFGGLCVLMACLAFPMGMSFMSPSFDYGSTAVGKADRYLNEKMYFDLFKFLSVDAFFLAMLFYLRVERSWGWRKLGMLACVFVIVVVVTLYPLLAIINVAMIAACDNPPIFDEREKRAIFPYSRVIESHYESIAREYGDYERLHDARIECTFSQTPAFKIGEKNKDKCWRMIMLKKAGRFTDDGLRHFPAVCKICDCKAIHSAFFSILDPHVNIPPHIGYYKGYLRYHLGVVIPQEGAGGPYINVGGENYFWENGQGVLFDDKFLHYVNNPTARRRVVLYIDLIRPLTGVWGAMNDAVINAIEHNPFVKYFVSRQHAQRKNDDG